MSKFSMKLFEVITEESEPISYNDRTFTIYSEDETLVGMSEIVIIASLEDYP